MKLGDKRWTTLIKRWSMVGQSPERDLLATVIGQAIADKERRDPFDRVPMDWTTPALLAYCRLIGVDAAFLDDQVVKALAYQD